MKQILFIAMLAVVAVSAKAQDTIFVDRAGQTVKSRQLADCYRIVKPYADGRKLKVTEFFLSGKLKTESDLKDVGLEKPNWVLDGVYKSWYENGKRQSVVEYTQGIMNGKLLTYWPNGILKRKDEYEMAKFVSGKCYNDKGKEIEYSRYYQVARFVGGNDSLFAYLRRNIRQIPGDSAKELRGNVMLNFTVGADGAISDVSVKKSSDTRLNQEAIRLISDMPRWLPARLDGDSVKSFAKQFVYFGKNANSDGSPFVVVEQIPQFVGGSGALTNFIQRNFRYPVSALESNIQGVVYVRFVVTETGEISQVSVLRGLGGVCDEEAMRIVGLMPRWIPGKQGGVPVPVWFTLPIGFKIMNRTGTDTFNTNRNQNFNSF